MHNFKNKEIAKILDELATMLKIKGENKYKVRAYENISRKLTTISEEISDLVAEGRLKEVQGIGDGIAAEIEDIFEKGFSPALEDLKNEVPTGVVEMTNISGLGPKSAHKLYNELDIKSIEELKKALIENEVRTLEGFGEKTEKKLLESVNDYNKNNLKMTYSEAEEKINKIIEELKAAKNLSFEIEIAGSFRRKKELITDIDILIITSQAKKIRKLIKDSSFLRDIIKEGENSISIYIKDGIRVDFRLLNKENKAAALQYFTGSKEHNVKIRKLAKEKSFKLNEYNLISLNKKDDSEEKVEVNSESDIYNKLGLEYIVPELREDRGEIEAAQNDNLPDLVKLEDIKGDLHIHSKYSDGAFSIEEITKKAIELNYEYLAITDHSQSLKIAQGMSTKEIYKQREEINSLRKKYSNIKILSGIEVDILKDGELDYSNEILAEFDLVIASIHSGFNQSSSQITNRLIKAMNNKNVNIIAHPQGRLLNRRKSYAVDMDEVISVAKKTNTALEINASPQRLDLDDELAKKAAKIGVNLVINTDSHHLDQFSNMKLGINVARRAWLEKDDLLNTKKYKKLKEVLK
ncbi:MAG: DNA polymerase/3'-5' exonuclease PolX [Bacillota bacterium]